jgi:hypothetical protein
VDATREETGIAGKSASNTPYPNTTILFDSGDDEDDDIKCGRCENPIAYCHCSPTMLPPRINVDEEEDNEETLVSPSETANNESRPVEVHVGRGMEGETNHGGRVQAHHRRMYAPGTLQRLTRHSLSPTPDGFIRNQGLNYVPFRIPTTNGRGVAPAKYVMVRMGINPTVAGCMYKGGVVYQGDVHAVPSHDHGDRVPDYTHEQLRHFRSDYARRNEVDEALEHIGDKSLLAEVSRFCGTMDAMKRLQDEIREREDELYCCGNDNHKCVRCLERAHALGRVFEEEEIANGLRVITPWALERQRQHAEEW